MGIDGFSQPGNATCTKCGGKTSTHSVFCSNCGHNALPHVCGDCIWLCTTKGQYCKYGPGVDLHKTACPGFKYDSYQK